MKLNVGRVISNNNTLTEVIYPANLEVREGCNCRVWMFENLIHSFGALVGAIMTFWYCNYGVDIEAHYTQRVSTGNVWRAIGTHSEPGLDGLECSWTSMSGMPAPWNMVFP